MASAIMKRLINVLQEMMEPTFKDNMGWRCIHWIQSQKESLGQYLME